MKGRKFIGSKEAPSSSEDVIEGAPLGGTRAEATQRLQVGLVGIAAMVLMILLASVVQDRARLSDEMTVPDAAATSQPVSGQAQRDPLAEAGVVPDMPAETAPSPSATNNPAIGDMPDRREGNEQVRP